MHKWREKEKGREREREKDRERKKERNRYPLSFSLYLWEKEPKQRRRRRREERASIQRDTEGCFYHIERTQPPFSGYRRVPVAPHILTYHILCRTSGAALSFSLRFALTDCLRLAAHPFASSRWLRSLPEDTPGVVWVSTEPVVGFPRARQPAPEKTSRLIIISMSRQGRRNAHDIVRIAKFAGKKKLKIIDKYLCKYTYAEIYNFTIHVKIASGYID